jgi:LSD1 subclass zinc finger protein
MNSELEYLFVDTDIFPSPTEITIFKNTIETDKGFIAIDSSRTKFSESQKCLFSLSNKGLLEVFRTLDFIYFYSPNHINCRPISISFNMYFCKMVRGEKGELIYLNNQERQKIQKGRKFISKWVYNQKDIPDEVHLSFIKLFMKQMPYIISIPHFKLEEFIHDIDETGNEYTILTPEYNEISCSVCRFKTFYKEGQSEIKCPSCGKTILIR